MSNDKSEVAKARREHRPKMKVGLNEIRWCPMQPVGDGTMARASLIPEILRLNAERVDGMV